MCRLLLCARLEFHAVHQCDYLLLGAATLPTRLLQLHSSLVTLLVVCCIVLLLWLL